MEIEIIVHTNEYVENDMKIYLHGTELSVRFMSIGPSSDIFALTVFGQLLDGRACMLTS